MSDGLLIAEPGTWVTDERLRTVLVHARRLVSLSILAIRAFGSLPPTALCVFGLRDRRPYGLSAPLGHHFLSLISLAQCASSSPFFSSSEGAYPISPTYGTSPGAAPPRIQTSAVQNTNPSASRSHRRRECVLIYICSYYH
jgi:hypothetical protein